MSTYWKPTVRQIQDSELVDASITNQPIQDQTSREEFLYNAIQSLSLSAGRVVRSGMPLSSDTEVLDIVYYDPNLGQYAPALAEVTYVNGQPQATARAYAVGMVLTASGGTGDVLLFGNIFTQGQSGQYTIDPLSMLDVAQSSFIDGIYYLSRQAPGKISSVPAAPLVQLGWFGIGAITFLPVYSGLLQTHFHYSFGLSARPSASQNHAYTGWWQFSGDGQNRKFVDYFNRGTSSAPPAIIATIRWTGTSTPAPVRIQLYRSSSAGFSVTLNSGSGLDYTNPASVAGTVVDISEVPWPAYGTYVALGSTGLEVAFLRWDQNYTNSLSVDAAALLTLNTDVFMFFLPNDLQGWTNANSFDLNTPAGVLYRYVLEGQSPLANAFPPLPLESAVLENNGTGMDSGTDFAITLGGIWWIPSGVSAPWPVDFTPNGAGMNAANARDMVLYFTKSTSSNQDAEVTSLQSLSPALIIRSCPDGLPAVTGNLTINLDLSLQVNGTPVYGNDLAIIGVSGETFSVGPIVSDLVAGPGIDIERLSPSQILNNTLNTGKLQISRKDVNLEGDITSVALRNAKEVIYPIGSGMDGYAYVAFPPPSLSSSAIIGRFKLPAAGLTTGAFTLNIYAQALGDTPTTVLQNAVFKVTYQALRPGFSMNDLVDSKAMAIQYWTVPFAANYVAYNVLASEIPIPPSGSPTAYNITTSGMQATSPVYIAGGLQDGDLVSVTIRRVLTDNSSNPDTYAGDVGFAGLRWAVTT